MKRSTFLIGLGLLSFATGFLVTAAAHSATVDPPEANPFVLVYADPLADIPNSVFEAECIMPEDLENFWASQGSGKGLRAPRLCMVDPCAEVLSREDLGRFWFGREVSFTEWRQYSRLMNAQCNAGLAFIPDDVLLASIFNGYEVPLQPVAHSPSQVPLPAGVWMLAAAIGGLGAISKVRKV